MPWENRGRNVILQFDGFYISYNPDTSQIQVSPGMRAMHEMMVKFGIMPSLPQLCGDYGGCDETALCLEETNDHWVLNGDFREEFEAAAENGFESCLLLYKQLRVKHRSSWSDGDMDEYEEDEDEADH